jgi:hypothetical protein
MEQQSLSEVSKGKLLFSAKWAKNSAILTVINLGLALIQLIVQGVKGDASVLSSLMTFLISAVISIVLSVNLFKYAKFSKRAIEQHHAVSLSDAYYSLKVYFSIIGVLMIILISLLTLGIAIGILAAAIN